MPTARLQRILLTLCRPKVAFPLILVAALLFGPFIYRAYRIGSVPDIGDPFDVEAFLAIEVPEEDNAWPLYLGAATKRIRPGTLDGSAWATHSRNRWDEIHPALKQWVVDNREFSQLWKAASDRPQAWEPDLDPNRGGKLNASQDFRAFVELARLEALRHAAQGRMDEAWIWYRAVYRSCLHLRMDGPIVSDCLAIALERIADGQVLDWAQNPAVGPEVLRQALDDLADIGAATPPPSHQIKFQYVQNSYYLTFIDLSGIDFDLEPFPSDYAMYVLNEPDYSRCILQLVYRNWLAHIDKPHWQRPLIVPGKYGLYEEPPGTSPEGFTPKQIEGLTGPLIRTIVEFEPRYIAIRDKRDRERRQLILHLTAELYRREQGDYPAKAEDLLDGYLDELPVDPLTGEPLEYDPFAVGP